MSTLETQNLLDEQPTSPPTLSGRMGKSLVLYLPLFIASVVVIWYCIDSFRTRVGMHYPLDPWESIFIMDAARVANGLPPYEARGVGHATHMYGPLGTYVIGAIHYFAGSSVRVGRWLSLFSGLTATLIYLILFTPRRNLFYLVVGAALFLSLHIRCMGLFTNTRPDMTAYMLSTVAVIAAYRAQERNQPGWYFLTAALIVIAFLFKQTYAAIALIPPVAVVMLRPPHWRRILLPSLAPLAAMAIAGITLKLFFPLIWFYAINVPRLYHVYESRINLAFMSLFMYNPLYLVMMVVLVFQIGLHPSKEPKLAWLFICMFVAGAMGIIAFAKQGGTYNSLLLIYGPMTAMCMLTLPRFMDWLWNVKVNPLVMVLSSLSLAMMVVSTTFGTPLTMRLAFNHSNNTEGYSRIIQIAKSLDGPVMCPEEPTITLFANGQFEKHIEAEIESVGHARFLPEWLKTNLAPAQWIISIRSADIPGRLDPILTNYGFRRVSRRGMPRGYGLWMRYIPANQIGNAQPAATQPAATQPQ